MQIGHALVVAVAVCAALGDAGSAGEQKGGWPARLAKLSECFRLYSAMPPDLAQRFPLRPSAWQEARPSAPSASAL